MNLYSIANKYQELLTIAVDQETGEVNEQALNELSIIGDDIKDKGIAVASYIKNLEAERDAINEAKKNMAEREARLDNKVNYLTQYLQKNMVNCGINEISCPQFVIKLKKCPWSTEITNEEFIPEKYKKHKDVVTLDRMKLKEDMLSGIEIPGAIIKQNTRIEIR